MMHRLVKVPKADLSVWDEQHDVLGHKIETNVSFSGESRAASISEK